MRDAKHPAWRSWREPREPSSGQALCPPQVGTTWPLLARYGGFFVLGRPDLRLSPTHLEDFVLSPTPLPAWQALAKLGVKQRREIAG